MPTSNMRPRLDAKPLIQMMTHPETGARHGLWAALNCHFRQSTEMTTVTPGMPTRHWAAGKALSPNQRAAREPVGRAAI
jgi:hypothetical protein